MRFRDLFKRKSTRQRDILIANILDLKATMKDFLYVLGSLNLNRESSQYQAKVLAPILTNHNLWQILDTKMDDMLNDYLTVETDAIVLTRSNKIPDELKQAVRRYVLDYVSDTEAMTASVEALKHLKEIFDGGK